MRKEGKQWKCGFCEEILFTSVIGSAGLGPSKLWELFPVGDPSRWVPVRHTPGPNPKIKIKKDWIKEYRVLKILEIF